MRGIGLDAEQVARFEKLAAGEQPWRLVYSAREAEHLAAQPQAAQAFCAAFCCKEALCKALGEFYSFPEFECLYRPGAPEQEFVLAPGLKERHGIEEVRVRIDEQFLGERGEFVVEVYLIRRQPGGFPARTSRRSRSRRWRPSAGGSRRNTSRPRRSPLSATAGRRASRALWRSSARWSGCGPMRVQHAAAPRDFELGHHASGAPRLVAAPAGVALADVFVSISHTRQWAYGLAAAGR